MHRIQCSNDVPTSEPGTCRPTGPKMPGDRGLLPTDLLVLGKPSNGASEVKVLHGRNTIFGCGLLPISDWGYQKPTRIWGSPQLLDLPSKLCDPGHVQMLALGTMGGGPTNGYWVPLPRWGWTECQGKNNIRYPQGSSSTSPATCWGGNTKSPLPSTDQKTQSCLKTRWKVVMGSL